jgi:membrane protease subunit HflC
MKNAKVILVFAVILGFYVLLTQSLFVLEEGQQVVITQFGRTVGAPITEAGFNFKLPFIQEKHLFDKRLLAWDGDPNQIPTKDKKYIWVDTTARWRIVDALKFLQTVTTYQVALSRLDDIIDSVVRDIVSSNILVEVVRSHTWKPLQRGESAVLEGEEEQEADKKIAKIGRQRITRAILEAASKLTIPYGIELVDVRIKRLNYVESVRGKVYGRMISERNRIAAGFRSEGEGKKAGIIGKMEKELQQIKSEAYKKAETIKGQADAESTQIYGQAYNQDPEFYEFYKTLETYKNIKNDNAYLILTTDSDFYKYIKQSQ